MPYVPIATQTTEPQASRFVGSAAEEFRTLKTQVNSDRATAATNLAALQLADQLETSARELAISAEAAIRAAADSVESANRARGDADLLSLIMPVINQVALQQIPGVYDYGLVADPIVTLQADYGTL
jgi:hypothetical protein